MEFQEVFEKVRHTIAESCGISEDLITPESTLFNDLKVDSIDMVDILFVLESEYNISLKVNDAHVLAKKEMGDTPYEVDGIITDDGLETLRRKFPELDSDRIQPGLTVHELVKLITVKSLCVQVLSKINEAANVEQ